MVVSGLPVRNHNEHAREIARMSLSILEQVAQFIIRHQPAVPLQARLGFHSGNLGLPKNMYYKYVPKFYI